MRFVFGVKRRSLRQPPRAGQLLQEHFPHQVAPPDHLRGRQPVEDILPLPPRHHDPRDPKDHQVLRDVGPTNIQDSSQLRDRPLPVAQRVHDLEAVGIA